MAASVRKVFSAEACDARRCIRPQLRNKIRNSRGVGRGISPRPQPRTGRASFQASGSPDCLDHWNASALGRTPLQSVAAGASMLPMLLRRFPQSSLDHFHVHREPSRLVNPSVAQNDTSCRPSPCGWLSQPRTTTTAPPLVCLIGETWDDKCRLGCVITLLKRASLVPILTLKHPRLGFDV
jgi:hypothetical protein